MDYQHLTQEQIYQILGHLQAGSTQTEIAIHLQVNKSTISRELKRNRGKRGYRPKQAQFISESRRKDKPSSSIISDEIHMLVTIYLLEKWSPDQISNYLSKEFDLLISHESIYRFVRADKESGGNLYKSLRQGQRKRKKKYGLKSATRGIIKERVSISERPKVVDEKSRVGDWEGDTVVSRESKSVLITLVERKTKTTLIKRVPNKLASTVGDGIIDMLTPYKDKVHTITFDNGKEFANHKVITKSLDIEIYFADPFSSWQRGVNENTNGLIRQYLPKKTDFSKVSDEEIKNIQKDLNNRPRKTLKFSTPSDIFSLE